SSRPRKRPQGPGPAAGPAKGAGPRRVGRAWPPGAARLFWVAAGRDIAVPFSEGDLSPGAGCAALGADFCLRAAELAQGQLSRRGPGDGGVAATLTPGNVSKHDRSHSAVAG